MTSLSNTSRFASIDPLQLTPSESLLPTTFVQLPFGVVASAGRSRTDGSSFDLPGFDEHLLFIQLQHCIHLDLKLDRRYTADSIGGDATMIPRGHATNWRTRGTADAIILCLPQTMFADGMLHTAGAPLREPQFIPRVGFRDPLTSALGCSIYEALRENGPLNQLYLESMLLTLAVHLVRSNTKVAANMGVPKRGLSTTALREVVAYIEANLDRELSLAEIAAQAQYSPFHLSRCFRTSTGKPLHQFVLECRIERAKHMLETTNLPLTEVALRTGFASHSQFTSHFRRKYLTTPSEFRRHVLGAANKQQESYKD